LCAATGVVTESVWAHGVKAFEGNYKQLMAASVYGIRVVVKRKGAKCSFTFFRYNDKKQS